MPLRIAPDLLPRLCDAYLAELRPQLGVLAMHTLPLHWTHLDQNDHPTASFAPLHAALTAGKQARVHTYGQTRFRIEAHQPKDRRPYLRITVVEASTR